MADTRTPEQRSYNMSRIGSIDTKPEVIVRRFLFSKGFRFRKNDRRYPGKPDIVLPRYRVMIFINGCFWHGHENCKFFALPKSNESFWLNKILKNKERDKEVTLLNTNEGWKVYTIWECQLKKDNFQKTMESLVREIELQGNINR